MLLLGNPINNGTLKDCGESKGGENNSLQKGGKKILFYCKDTISTA